MAQLTAFIETIDGELIAVPKSPGGWDKKQWQHRLDDSYKNRSEFNFPSSKIIIPIKKVRQYWIEEL